jgi:transposase
MPPAYVKPYVKQHKNDATDAEAICEAVTRPNMRFVATKTPEQQSCLMLHRTRHLFIRQQTSVINVIRAHLVEFEIVAPVGRHLVEQLLGVVADASDKRLPEVARACVAALGAQLQTLKTRILQFGRLIMAWHRSSEASRRLDDIPRKGKARQYQQTRRSLSAQPVHDRRACRHPLRQNPRHQTSALAHRAADAAIRQGRSHRASQQDGQNGVGDDGHKRTIQEP